MKIIFINGSRGEWGYIQPIIDILIEKDISYGIVATNMLVSQEHGMLVESIKLAGYNVVEEISTRIEGDTHHAFVKTMGYLTASLADTFKREQPDWIVLAGDRGEMLAACIASSYMYIPTAHIQAGERSGNIDGNARHAIGKLAHLHFASNHDAGCRLTRLGEEQHRIHVVGAPQLDELVTTPILPIEITLERLKIPNLSNFILVVNHPVTEELDSASENCQIMLEALNKTGKPLVIILPNNDAGGNAVKVFLQENKLSHHYHFPNVARSEYLSLLKHCDCLVGNSSSGLLEAPTFKTPVVNIGTRQANRVRGKNVIDCTYSVDSISKSLQVAMSSTFKTSLEDLENPYGDGYSSSRIVSILEETPIDSSLLVKTVTF